MGVGLGCFVVLQKQLSSGGSVSRVASVMSVANFAKGESVSYVCEKLVKIAAASASVTGDIAEFFNVSASSAAFDCIAVVGKGVVCSFDVGNVRTRGEYIANTLEADSGVESNASLEMRGAGVTNLESVRNVLDRKAGGKGSEPTDMFQVVVVVVVESELPVFSSLHVCIFVRVGWDGTTMGCPGVPLTWRRHARPVESYVVPRRDRERGVPVILGDTSY